MPQTWPSPLVILHLISSRQGFSAGFLGHAVGLEIQDPELTEVTYSLNALLEALDAVNPPGLENVEALPIILPPI